MAEHGSKLIRTLQEHANYPAHVPRRPTALYTKNHHRLIVEEDRGCLVCGVRHSDLQDPKRRNDPKINPVGATQNETHHAHIEDSLANAIDLAKFNKRVRPGLLKRTGNQGKYGHDFTQDEMLEWIHGDADQLWVLCDRHHRSPLIGSHAITGPIWGVQDLLLDGYDLTGFVPTSPVEAAQLEALPQTTGTAQSPLDPDVSMSEHA